jgi:hypothetical protein
MSQKRSRSSDRTQDGARAHHALHPCSVFIGRAACRTNATGPLKFRK